MRWARPKKPRCSRCERPELLPACTRRVDMVTDSSVRDDPVTTPKDCSSTDQQASTYLPQHVAFIMDGNGRWAQSRHLPRLAGHRAGVRNMHRIVRAAVDVGIPMITLYAFSTENWGRPTEEVEGLMEIFADAAERETKSLHRNGVRINHIGSFDDVPTAQRRAIEKAVELTRDNV